MVSLLGILNLVWGIYFIFGYWDPSGWAIALRTLGVQVDANCCGLLGATTSAKAPTGLQIEVWQGFCVEGLPIPSATLPGPQKYVT